jgi:hypothetical protein
MCAGLKREWPRHVSAHITNTLPTKLAVSQKHYSNSQYDTCCDFLSFATRNHSRVVKRNLLLPLPTLQVEALGQQDAPKSLAPVYQLARDYTPDDSSKYYNLQILLLLLLFQAAD